METMHNALNWLDTMTYGVRWAGIRDDWNDGITNAI